MVVFVARLSKYCANKIVVPGLQCMEGKFFHVFFNSFHKQKIYMSFFFRHSIICFILFRRYSTYEYKILWSKFFISSTGHNNVFFFIDNQIKKSGWFKIHFVNKQINIMFIKSLSFAWLVLFRRKCCCNFVFFVSTLKIAQAIPETFKNVFIFYLKGFE